MVDSEINPYLRDAVMTATPEQLQLMLYDGAIRFCRQARRALDRRDYQTSCDRLTRAQHIIVELLGGLNYEVDRGLCERVASIYRFLYHKLVDACVGRSVEAVDEALTVLQLERETWQLLVDRVASTRPEEMASAQSCGARRVARANVARGHPADEAGAFVADA